jgi:hypothetical protein
MAEDGTTLAAILVSAAGILLWIITQVHLLRVARRIETNIDTKRAETQAFVDRRLESLETLVGGFEARMTAQMPPNVHGELEDLKAEFVRQFQEIDRGLTAALGSIDQSFKGVIGNMGDAERELRKEMALVGDEATSALQEAFDSSDNSNPVVRRLYAWASRPVDPKLEAKNPIGAAALQLGKAALLERLQNESVGTATKGFLKRTTSFNPGL